MDMSHAVVMVVSAVVVAVVVVAVVICSCDNNLLENDGNWI